MENIKEKIEILASNYTSNTMILIYNNKSISPEYDQ
jgi:hypothetical protein